MNYYHVVIPHYFDVNDFDATQPKEDYFLFVGRLNFDKGITLAIDLAAKVGTRLKVCGQGNLSYLGYDKIPDHVDFIGYVGIEERKKIMSKAKCLIMPTIYMEPFGCVAIEAMLSGTPILTNDWGGPGENNVHGVTGFKCRTFEQFEWAARNIHLIDPKNCREWAEQNFSFDKVGHMYEEYFQSLQGIDWYKPNPLRTNLDHLKKHYPNAVSRKIPYNLFQTFKTKDISPALQAFMDTWKEQNPEYTYKFYDDDMCDKFMKEFDVRTWKAYRQIIPSAFKADLWRYCVLYKYGGVYADIDTVCVGKIDEFLSDTTEFVTPVIEHDNLLFNTFIAAAPGSKILKDCIDTIVHNVENNIVPENKIYFAGPGVLANCTNEFLGRDKNTSFAGQTGWHGAIHLLFLDHQNEYVTDTNGNILFQNKQNNKELCDVYFEECRKLKITPWFYCKDVLMPVTVTPNGIFETDPDDICIHKHVQAGEVYESHIINGPLKSYIEKSKYIVDVGANIGCHAISYANMNRTCNVWAFEPQEQLFGILSRNVTRNNLSDRINIYKYGLGHKEADTTLYSLDKEWYPDQGGHNKGGIGIGEGGESIKICTLDSLNLPGLDFMKIDVEGAEGIVLQGAAETIKKYKPVIFFEHNSQRIDPTVLGLEYVPTPFEVLATLGYTSFKLIAWDNYITEG
jgi:FkbM family methyltransferase